MSQKKKRKTLKSRPHNANCDFRDLEDRFLESTEKLGLMISFFRQVFAISYLNSKYVPEDMLRGFKDLLMRELRDFDTLNKEAVAGSSESVLPSAVRIASMRLHAKMQTQLLEDLETCIVYAAGIETKKSRRPR